MIPRWAAKYVGIPFLDRGRMREGLDCWGLLALVYRERFGIEIPPFDDRYRNSLDLREIARLIGHEREGPAGAQWRRVAAKEARAGDGILLLRAGRACHVGIWIAPGLMLHCEDRTDTVIERFDGPQWGRCLEGIYRWIG